MMISYQFALLRYRHSPTAGELVNVGVVMWLPGDRKLLHSIRDHYRRLSRFLQNFDGRSYRQMIRHLVSRITETADRLAEPPESGTDDLAPNLDKVLRLLSVDPDSCFQWSPVMAGMTKEPAESRLSKLSYEFILRHEDLGEAVGRSEKQIGQTIDEKLKSRRLVTPGRVEQKVTITGTHQYSWTFHSGWQNGTRQVLEPISFDYTNASNVKEKATTWIGRLVSLSTQPFQMTAVVAPPHRSENRPAFDAAVERLRSMQPVRAVVEEDDFERFLPSIETDLQHNHDSPPKTPRTSM